jgi:hypothetical protein
MDLRSDEELDAVFVPDAAAMITGSVMESDQTVIET